MLYLARSNSKTSVIAVQELIEHVDEQVLHGDEREGVAAKRVEAV